MSQLLHSPISHDHLLRPLVVPRLISTGRLAPWRHRIAATRGLTFTATMRVIYRVHGYAADMRTNSAPARATRFTQRNILVFDVTDLPNRGPALNRHPPHLARRHAQLSIRALLCQQLRERARSPRHLAAFAGAQLNIMNLRAQRNIPNRQGISRQNVRVFAARNRLTYFQSHRSNDVTLLAIDISHQSNVGR